MAIILATAGNDLIVLGYKEYLAALERAHGAGDSGGSITFEDFIEDEPTCHIHPISLGEVSHER